MFIRLITRVAVIALTLMAVFAAPQSTSSHPLPTTHLAPPTRLSSVARPWAPIILNQVQLPDLVGAPIDHLAVWVYRDEGWHTIPWQVDEVDVTGYTAHGDSRFNGADELVMMLDDLGQPAPTRLPDADIVHIVTVTDPLAPTDGGRVAYVARMTVPVAPPDVGYVQYDPMTRRVSTPRYVVGLNAQWPVLDYLALNGSGVNLMDRSKLRLILNDCGYTCSVMTEEQLPLPPMTPLKDGPVRVVLDNQGRMAYRDWLWLPTQVDLSIASRRAIQVQLSLDLAASLTGGRYRDANRPDGVVVDGEPDAVPAAPWSPWQAIDHATGRLVTQYQVRTPYGDLYNYYQERTTPLSADTGDKMAWGEHGIAIDEPQGGKVAVDMALWALPADTSLDGPILAQQGAAPLVVTVSRPQFPNLYLPLLRRGE
ncbi:MAG: hypothetical protein KIT87_05870 [Anaerolineae bacterium]|nr:hypothetical protein [Anaerolineae bacterium]